jgi:transposase
VGDATGTITMSMREADRLKTIQAVVDGVLRTSQAAQRLGLTARQVRRVLKRYAAQGAAGLVSRKRGRPSNHQLDAGLADRALALIHQRYTDFGPTLAREKLLECHGLTLGKETVRQLMMGAGLWSTRRQHAPPIHQPRVRRACIGELIQIDGSDHAWFEDRAPPCTLLVYIDDATSQLMALHFTPTESTFGYFEATRQYLQRHGKPVAFYSDKAAVFRPTVDSTDFGHGVTQFGRALYELNVDILCANTSQAKGRVERANLTLQDRLVKEMRLRGISTLQAANAFAPHFIADFNARFAKPPRSTFDAHRPLRADEDLRLIFTWRVQRKVSLSLTLQHDRIIYLLADTPECRAQIHRYIDVFEFPDGHIELRAEGRVLPCTQYDRLAAIDSAEVVDSKRLGRVLEVAAVLQAKRDTRHHSNTPSHTHIGQAPHPRRAQPGVKPASQLNAVDMAVAIAQVCSPQSRPKPVATSAVMPSIDVPVITADAVEAS